MEGPTHASCPCPSTGDGNVHLGETFRQRVDMLVFEYDGFRPPPTYGADFHQWLIVACRVETNRHVLGTVGVDEKYTSEHHSLGSKAGLAGK